MVARVCAAIAFGTWSLVALAGSSLAQPGLADPQRGHELAIDRQASSPTRADVPVTRLQPSQLPGQTARQLPDLSTIIRVESSSTDNSRLRGALPVADMYG